MKYKIVASVKHPIVIEGIRKEDQLLNPNQQKVATIMAKQLLHDVNPAQDHPVVLGGSMTWIAQIATLINPDFKSQEVPFSGHTYISNDDQTGYIPRPDRQPSKDAVNHFQNYLSANHLDAKSIVERDKKTVLLEYAEEGRGLYTLIDQLKESAKRQDISFDKVKEKLRLWVYQNQTGYRSLSEKEPFKDLEITFIYKNKKWDAAMKALCDDDTTRRVPQFKWYAETQAKPLNNQAEVEAKLQMLEKRIDKENVKPEKLSGAEQLRVWKEGLDVIGQKPVIKGFVETGGDGKPKTLWLQGLFNPDTGESLYLKHKDILTGLKHQPDKLPKYFEPFRLKIDDIKKSNPQSGGVPQFDLTLTPSSNTYGPAKHANDFAPFKQFILTSLGIKDQVATMKAGTPKAKK